MDNTIRVNVYRDAGSVCLAKRIPLDQCGLDQRQLIEAKRELQKAGRYWVGNDIETLLMKAD